MVVDDGVVCVVRDNAASLLRLARVHSLCDDDAADAYQRTLEIYLGRVDRVDHASAGAWLRTVCKHEAMRLRAARQRVLPTEAVDWDERPSVEAVDLEERAASMERVARAAEALQRCAPDEVRALLLRADGSSYREISAQLGWSYSKVNRLLASGRARFLAGFAQIDSGAACATHLPVLAAIVDGEATPEDFLSLRPHLRHCAGCRATLKAMYEAEPALGALVPAGALVVAAPGLLGRTLEGVSTSIGDRLVRAHSLFEAAGASKAAAVVASTAAVAAGGAAAVDHWAPPRRHVAAHLAAARVVARVATPTLTPTATVASPVPTATVAAPAATAPPVTPTPTATPTSAPTSTPPEPFAPVERAPPATPSRAPVAARRAPSAAPGEFGIEG